VRAPAKRLVAVVLGLLLGPLLGEAWVRVTKPDARTQIIAPQPELEIWALGETRVWRGEGGLEREARGCQASDRVLVLGSSILYGAGVEADQTWSSKLALPGTCVHNLSGSGYGVEAKLARLEAELPELSPRLVVWEVWANDANRFIWVGSRGYSLNPSIPLDARGVPNAWGLPPVLNEGLFRASRAYELLTLTGIEPSDGQPDLLGPLERVREGVEQAGAELLLVFPPTLDKPLSASVEEPTDFQRKVQPWAQQRGLRTLALAELLADQDHEAIRLDPCCHYNAGGHAVLAERLAPHLAP
jgi:hypothetical protein